MLRPTVSGPVSWCQEPIWGPRRAFYYFQTEAGLLMSLSFTIAPGTRQYSHLRFRILRDSWPSFTVSDSRLLQSGGLGFHIYTPQNRVAQLYPQAPGSLFVASYDLQGYGGSFRTRLHAVWLRLIRFAPTYRILKSFDRSI
jgi:hypothetical protein